MKKIKYLILCFIGAFVLAFAAGCSADDKIDELETKVSDLETKNSDLETKNNSLKTENDSLKSELESLKKENENLKKLVCYQIEVYDWDNSKLGSKNVSIYDYDTFYEGLVANFEVEATESTYGHYITSINNSLVDPNYSMMIYKNGEASAVGVDSIEFSAGDVFTFKNECWNTVASGWGKLDETDILVDKIVYGYAKNYLDLSKQTTFTASNYWDFMTINLIGGNSSYKNTLYNTSSVSDTFKSALKLDSISKPVDYGKYYYAAKALGVDLTDFKTKYSEYLASDSFTSSYVAYTSPFVIGANKALEINNEKITTMVSSGLTASTKWGIDDLAWQTSVYTLYTDYTKEDLTTFEVKDYGNAASTALAIMAYSCAGINVRSVENTDGKDLIEILVENYYDSTKNFVNYSSSQTGVQFSTNQIYAALVAYKVCRDTGSKAALFA